MLNETRQRKTSATVFTYMWNKKMLNSAEWNDCCHGRGGGKQKEAGKRVQNFSSKMDKFLGSNVKHSGYR